MGDEVGVRHKLGTSLSQVALHDRDILQEMHDVEMDNDRASGSHEKHGMNGQTDINGGVRSPDNVGRADLICGWLGCRPRWIQKMCTARWLLVVMCLGTFFQGFFVSGFLPSSITSLERRFGFSSQQTGLLISIYEIVSVFLVLFVCYLGDRGHKLRWVSVGCVLIAIAACLFALPHFTTPTYSYASAGPSYFCTIGNTSVDECSSTTSTTTTTSSDLFNYYYVFVAAMVVGAIGALPMYTLGLTALDESVTSSNNGIYIGIFYAVATLGPGCGFLVAGVCLSYFTELRIPEGLNLSPLDPGWVGAWWIGFIISFVMLLITAVPMSLFPRELPTTAKIRAEKEDQSHKNAGSNVTSQAGFGTRPTDFFKAIKYLFVNPTFMFTCLGGVANTLIFISFGTFLPKLFENQFSVSASLATILTGIIVVIGGILGTLNGGLIMRRLKLKVKGMLRLIIVCNILAVLLSLVTLWQCPGAKLAGVTASYDDTELTATNVTHSCNAGCSCAEDIYIPVCADGDTMEYLSPCHAGCIWGFFNGTFIGCSCLAETGLAESTTATFGACSSSCPYYYPFVYAAVFIVLIIITFTTAIPELNVLLRSVPDTQRSMALGLNSLLLRLLGAFPGPILFGAVIDGACLLWQETCGTRGSCWVYDNQGLAWRITVIAVVLKLVGVLFYVLALALYKTADKDEDTKGDLKKEVTL
ncbi:solute carrier organic anion transporter family member 4A1 [Strongylocentrotus purpuratus]|uniref:Solute carrier organic anion transporter family member n=1 Tax=Strongylocentrotus purpuratus TaxID=7668 RepID=A0A7M7NYX0_STRPU|nr:solute carrier organic anion transporter family member 4A1 [Strongylocentrotus purpuratus]XP_030842731.1 solute carrier organic anion transporter family member 4A1 [Strongylocentrotus purpuratus]XP_030842732.1 solute carrier organic anion transporter family member 4A1 [Strongylocentrotus purpuratus]XP_030842733.1 solute carrier organic anion transporter family member 4A1 [Strongylocentrotus purpuratus]